MAETFLSRLKSAWNIFANRDPTENSFSYSDFGLASTYPLNRTRMSIRNERSIISSIYNRIAVDVSSVDIKHVRLDQNGRFLEEIDSSLNNCLTLEANVDQTSRAFIKDIVLSMFDEGVVAVVPVDTEVDPMNKSSMKIETMRVGKITQWYPQYVEVELYNDRTGNKEKIKISKIKCAIIENPFYEIMNQQNSTVKRLTRKLALLDGIDEQTSSGKMNMIIQLPYVIKTDARKKEADKRRKEIETQLYESPYGIAYTDGTEKIVQLNRPLENNLLEQIKYLQDNVFDQLSMTTDIMNGTANEQTMLNYNNRTIEPIISAITAEFKRKFLTKTARSQGQTIMSFKDPFRLVPVNQIAEIADKFTRNEIMTSNEIRQIIGMLPADDPNADELRNKNLNKSNEDMISEEYTDPNIMNDSITDEEKVVYEETI